MGTRFKRRCLHSDRLVDLNLKFLTQTLVEVLGYVNDGEEIVLALKGELSDGTPFEGVDDVLIIDKRIIWGK